MYLKVLSRDDVIEIISRFINNGESAKEIARSFGVNRKAIYRALHGETKAAKEARAFVPIDRLEQMLHYRGKIRSNAAKLWPREVIDIRTRAANGERYIDIGRSYGMSENGISQIVRGLRYKYVRLIGR